MLIFMVSSFRKAGSKFDIATPRFFNVTALDAAPELKCITVSETANCTFHTPQNFVLGHMLHKTLFASFWFSVSPKRHHFKSSPIVKF